VAWPDGWFGSLGLEPDMRDYIRHLMQIMEQVKRVLKPTGTCWVNLGDSYSNQGKWGGQSGNKNATSAAGGIPRYKRDYGVIAKSLCQIPSRFALAMTDAGWILRNEIVWYKRNCMPSSVKDRFTVDFEKVFFFVKWPRYYFKQQREENANPSRTNYRPGKEAYSEGNVHDASGRKRRNDGFEAYAKGKVCDGRNMRCVWDVPTKPNSDSWDGTSRLHRAEPDVLSGDNWHIVSPSCPEHGYLYHLLSIFSDDEHSNDLANHISRNDIRHVQELLSCSSPIDLIRAWGFREHTPDSLHLHSVLSAIVHNNESHRTGHVPDSISPYRLSVETLSHIGHILKERGLSEQNLDMLLNNTLPDEMDVHLLDQILCRKIDNSSSKSPFCLCTIYRKETKKSSHFAMFPDTLVTPMLSAGCPVGGTVLDPFAGMCTVGLVAARLGMDFVGIELSEEYAGRSEERLEEGR